MDKDQTDFLAYITNSSGHLLITVTGSDGSIGVYSGAIAAIPEPETYAMVAGLGLMGAVVRRRSNRKTS